VEVRFICRQHVGNLIHWLSQSAFPVTVLPAPERSDSLAEDYAAWLGVSPAIDAAETIEALAGDRPDWLIVDHYGIDRVWEQQLRPYVGRIFAIDDLANRPHDCDLLLDQNLNIGGEERYRHLVPPNCRQLIGPRYALLRPEYRAYRQTLPTRTGQVQRVLVFFGSTDPQNMTGKVLEALDVPEFSDLAIDVVVGATSPHRSTLEALAARRSQIQLHYSRPHLADLMAQADLAIGSGGTVSWERCCLQLPTLVVSVAENQVSACEALAALGAIVYLGAAVNVGVEELRRAIGQFREQPATLQDIAVNAGLQVDGLGSQRVVELLTPTPIEALKLRLAQAEDTSLFYDWVNESEVRRQSLQGQPISWNTHQLWFQHKLSDPDCYIGVLEAQGLPVGQIRFDLKGDEAVIDYSLDILVRGRSWATHLIRLGMSLLDKIHPTYIRAEVKVGNPASRAVFLRLGFSEDSPPPTATRVSGDSSLSLAILSDKHSWLNHYLPQLVLAWLHQGHRVQWTHDVDRLSSGDLCFYLSCGQIVSKSILDQFCNNLVVHESDLPRGKGWSPLTWQILEGKNRIPVTLFEAAEKVDSGDIYLQEWLEFEGHELLDELRQAQAKATLRLCSQFVDQYPEILKQAQPQTGTESFYPRRRARDSQLDINVPLVEQFNLLRVVDNEKYPAFLKKDEHLFKLLIIKSLES
jgi:UDP-2,4-diacetamido-2,4,6-trideoxy-beta-L-altropyranose hydrolase